MSREGEPTDGREQALLRYVQDNVTEGDLDGAIEAVDAFCYSRCVMMNVGEEKGAILEAAVRRASPQLTLELGTYCGYSALRIARALPPGGRVVSLERDPARAELAQELIAHAGAADRVEVVLGDLGAGGETLAELSRRGLGPRSVGFLFLDHAKDAYLRDLQLLLEAGLLAPGARILADNLRIPGSPRYLAYIRAQEGKLFRTTEHHVHLEYQRILPDLLCESVYLGPEDAPSSA